MAISKSESVKLLDNLFQINSFCDNQFLDIPQPDIQHRDRMFMDIQQTINRHQTNRQKVAEKAGRHKKLVVTKSWMSQKAGCHKKLDVTKSWTSQRAGRHKSWLSQELDVTKSWTSQKAGRHKSWLSQELDVTKSWMSQELVVTGAGCLKLFVTKLFVTKLVVSLP